MVLEEETRTLGCLARPRTIDPGVAMSVWPESTGMPGRKIEGTEAVRLEATNMTTTSEYGSRRIPPMTMRSGNLLCESKLLRDRASRSPLPLLCRLRVLVFFSSCGCCHYVSVGILAKHIGRSKQVRPRASTGLSRLSILRCRPPRSLMVLRIFIISYVVGNLHACLGLTTSTGMATSMVASIGPSSGSRPTTWRISSCLPHCCTAMSR